MVVEGSWHVIDPHVSLSIISSSLNHRRLNVEKEPNKTPFSSSWKTKIIFSKTSSVHHLAHKPLISISLNSTHDNRNLRLIPTTQSHQIFFKKEEHTTTADSNNQRRRNSAGAFHRILGVRRQNGNTENNFPSMFDPIRSIINNSMTTTMQ